MTLVFGASAITFSVLAIVGKKPFQVSVCLLLAGIATTLLIGASGGEALGVFFFVTNVIAASFLALVSKVWPQRIAEDLENRKAIGVAALLALAPGLFVGLLFGIHERFFKSFSGGSAEGSEYIQSRVAGFAEKAFLANPIVIWIFGIIVFICLVGLSVSGASVARKKDF